MDGCGSYGLFRHRVNDEGDAAPVCLTATDVSAQAIPFRRCRGANAVFRLAMIRASVLCAGFSIVFLDDSVCPKARFARYTAARFAAGPDFFGGFFCLVRPARVAKVY